jgi:hypothetical protein
MDSLLFSAYNNTDIDKYTSLISEDIEFFHDKNGLINTKERVVESLKKLVKKKNTTPSSLCWCSSLKPLLVFLTNKASHQQASLAFVGVLHQQTFSRISRTN